MALASTLLAAPLVRDDDLGFALAAAKTIVESHGGTIGAANVAGGGCVVTLTLPRRVT